MHIKAAEDAKAVQHARAAKKAEKLRLKQAEEIAYAAGEAAGLQQAAVAAAERAKQEAQEEEYKAQETHKTRQADAAHEAEEAHEVQVAQRILMSGTPHLPEAYFPHKLEDDKFEMMLDSISTETTYTSPCMSVLAKQSLVDDSEAHRTAVHANLEILQQNTIVAERCFAELEQRSYHLHVSIEETTAALLQTQTDLEMCSHDLE